MIFFKMSSCDFLQIDFLYAIFLTSSDRKFSHDRFLKLTVDRIEPLWLPWNSPVLWLRRVKIRLIFLFLRRYETPPSPPTPNQVGIENCKQLFSKLLAFTTQKIATHNTDIITAIDVAFFSVVNASRNEKSCLQFLIPSAVFQMLLIRLIVLSFWLDGRKIERGKNSKAYTLEQ